MKNKLLASAALAAGLVVVGGWANLAQARDETPPPSQWGALFPNVDASAGDQTGAQAGSQTGANAGPELGTWGFDVSGMDPKAKPGDSFFQFADGGWYARTPIPSDKTRYGMFDKLFDLSQQRVRTIIEDSAKSGAPADSDSAKIGGLYHAFMDEDRIEKLDAQPLQHDLAAIRAIQSKTQMARFMGASHGGPGASFFRANVDVDSKDPTHYGLTVFQSGLGLPNRDYYLKDTFAAKKAKYRDYVAGMLERIGWPDPGKRADEIVAMETKVAEASWSITESRQREKTYNPVTLAQLTAQAPGFDWAVWLKAANVGGAKKIVLFQNTALPKIAKIYAETPLATLKAWEAFRLADEMAPYLSRRFDDAHFAFRGKELLGQPVNTPRWKRGVNEVDDALGEAVGREYVARYFPASSKAAMEDLVGQLKIALQKRIERLDWMSGPTKAKALEKLSMFGVKIGYPTKWRDYSKLRINPDDLAGDVRRAGEFEWNWRSSRLGKEVDRTEWGMTPQTVNAYYNSARNEIVFPAAILQPPFFDPKADMAINYGGIGGVIGHEMTHGFDDQGRKSDGHGVLTDWWTAEDAAKFNVQAAKYGAQYDTYFVAPNVHVIGSQTMGENIGDLGGINLGLDAYHASLHGQPAPVIDGFTGDQRVFLGWAQVWREKFRPDALISRVTVDVHSPAEFRVIGPLRNVDAWYEAWGVKPGDKYYVAPEDRVRIW
jgi:putative endopeptidase